VYYPLIDADNNYSSANHASPTQLVPGFAITPQGQCSYALSVIGLQSICLPLNISASITISVNDFGKFNGIISPQFKQVKQFTIPSTTICSLVT